MALHAVRYGIPLALLGAGMVVTGTSGHLGIESGALQRRERRASPERAYRIGVEGDKERDTEQSARDFFDQHGHWPDEPPSAARRRPQPRAPAASRGARSWSGRGRPRELARGN